METTNNAVAERQKEVSELRHNFMKIFKNDFNQIDIGTCQCENDMCLSRFS